MIRNFILFSMLLMGYNTYAQTSSTAELSKVYVPSDRITLASGEYNPGQVQQIILKIRTKKAETVAQTAEKASASLASAYEKILIKLDKSTYKNRTKIKRDEKNIHNHKKY